MKKLLLGLLLMIVLLGGAWYVFVRESKPKPRPAPTYNFSQEGILEKKGNGWSFGYTENGTRKSASLEFTDDSICALRGVGAECDEDDLENGRQANLQGVIEGTEITVVYLTVL